ncbi:hypothetical protein BDN67DRAFT_974634 [Paxillus ammoniavirescens]|nr:hypothetical protein BDN67DRAFT_974634 [Paxillus ammoniavirescens]
MGSCHRWKPRRKRSPAQAPGDEPASRSSESLCLSPSERVRDLTDNLRNALPREHRAKETVKETRKRAREAEAENEHVIAWADASHQRIGALETRNDSLVPALLKLSY